MSTRGGFARRGGRGGGSRGGHRGGPGAAAAPEPDFQDSPELSELRNKYREQLSQISVIFPDWSAESILLVLSESQGSAETAIARITDGLADQFESVGKKKKPVSRKEKEVAAVAAGHAGASQHPADAADTNNAGPTSSTGRGGGRGGRGGMASRGGRGRGDFRGARGGRGGRGGYQGRSNGHTISSENASAPAATDAASSGWGNTEGDAPAEVPATEGNALASNETSGWGDVPQQTEQVAQKTADANGRTEPAAPTKPAAPASAPSKPAQKTIPSGAKMSWAQIARPPPPAQPVPQQASAPVPQPPAPKVTIPEPSAIEEAAPLLPHAVDAGKAANAPAGEPSALPVGEGWADAVIAQEKPQSAEQTAQHERAVEAAPPAGVDPAGPLDVHTPVPEAVPSQQEAFNQPSALSVEAQRQPEAQAFSSATASSIPPGLAKRGLSRPQQDAPVVISGTSGTPDIEGTGVQFGSLNLFGSLPAQPNAEVPEQMQQQQQAAISKPLYETPLSHEQAPEVPQVQHVGSQTEAPKPAQVQEHSAYGAYQQQAQDRPSAFPAYNAPHQPQAASAYASRYPTTQTAYGQQSQHHLTGDTFAALSGGPAAAASPYAAQNSLASNANHDAIAQYFSQHQQATQPSSIASHSITSPASGPASTRDVGTAAPQAVGGSASAFGGFTSALGQQGQHHQQQQPQPPQQHHQPGYSNDYANVYGLSDPMRNLNYYNQYDQQHQVRTTNGDDVSAKLGASAPSANAAGATASGTPQQAPQQLGHQQQQQAQPQGYPPNFAPYPYYATPYGYYNQHGGMNASGYGGYQAAPYNAYPGYGPPGAGAGRPFPGQQQNASQQGGYRGSFGGNSAANSAPFQGNYGNAGYGGADTARVGSQGQGQDSRNAGSKDVFSDRFFGNQY